MCLVNSLFAAPGRLWLNYNAVGGSLPAGWPPAVTLNQTCVTGAAPLGSCPSTERQALLDLYALAPRGMGAALTGDVCTSDWVGVKCTDNKPR